MLWMACVCVCARAGGSAICTARLGWEEGERDIWRVFGCACDDREGLSIERVGWYEDPARWAVRLSIKDASEKRNLEWVECWFSGLQRWNKHERI